MLVFIILVVTAITAFYIYRREKLKYFTKLGIKGPEPNFLFGNLIELRKSFFPELLQKWAKMYGKVLGYYEGSTPVMVISDPDLLQEVFVKQFSNFHGRKLFPMQSDPDKESRVSMFMARGKRWKRLRTTINPAFSENKMRRMYPMIDDCILSMLDTLRDKLSTCDNKLDIQEPLQRLTIDIICKCAFGVETNCQKNVNHPFIVCLKRFLSGQHFSTLKAAFIMTFPELKHWIIKVLTLINKRPNSNPDLVTIREKLIEVIEARKKNTDKRMDLLQLLLDAEVPGQSVIDEDNLCPINNISPLVKDDDEKEENEEETNDTISPARTTQSNSKPMTTEEIIAQSNLFLFAGYETSSTALAFTIHALVEHPEIQRKLQKEIDEAFQDRDYKTMTPLDFYDAIAKLPYLNALIFEVLRHHPFASTVVSRLSLKSEGTYLSNGTFIAGGVVIVPNIYGIHFDSEIWTGIDPKKFEPERFLDSNGSSYEFIGPPHPLAWLPFGAGPRNCIGQRFAMMVIKSTIVRFCHRFTVSASENTEIPLKLRMGATIGPKNGVHILLNERISSKSDE